MRRTLVAGNWKMHGTRASNRALAADLVDLVHTESADVAVFPPFVHLVDVLEIVSHSRLAVGAQTASSEPPGALTGEIAVSMLSDLGCRFVIVGHSERRHLLGESDEVVAKKFVATLTAGLTPILCVGETLSERDADLTEAVVYRQLDAVLSVAGVTSMADAVIAYEPVWAIGTGRTASPEQAQAVHGALRRRLAMHDDMIAPQIRILYGGSVKAANAAELFSQPDVDGGLVGGASLHAEEFARIVGAAAVKRGLGSNES